MQMEPLLSYQDYTQYTRLSVPVIIGPVARCRRYNPKSSQHQTLKKAINILDAIGKDLDGFS